MGKVTEKCLREAIDVITCGDLFRERAACMHVMTPRMSRWLIKVRVTSLARVKSRDALDRRAECSSMREPSGEGVDAKFGVAVGKLPSRQTALQAMLFSH